MNDVWIVLSNPRDGRHDAFNDWYDNIHIRDILRQPGTAAAQRLRLADCQVAPGGGAMADRSFGYLALYELNDAEKVSAGQAKIFSPVMLVSDSFDFAACGAFYTPHAAQRDRSRAAHGALLLERMPASDDPAFADWYIRVRMPALLALPGVASAALTSYADHQMFPTRPESHFIALYELSDRDAALPAWAGAPPLPGGPMAQVACFEPLGPRLTVFDVAYPTPQMASAEAAARLTLGDRVYHSFPSA